jgi:cellulose synthase/poly-beta-1,6-N-acetylglucosamine synthase-like glycosyltransferase
MRSTLDRSVATAIVVLISVGGWVIAGASGILSTASRVSIYFVANLVLMFDMVDLVARLWITSHLRSLGAGPSVDLRLPDISSAEKATLLRPYAIIGSVHDASDDIDRFIEMMQPFKDVVWLIDDASSDDTLLRLRRLGWNCIAGITNRNKPGALFHLIKLLPAEIETVLVVDPDVKWSAIGTSARDTLEQVISDLQRSGAAALTPRISSHQPGWLEECQAFEYELSCGLGRKSLGYVCTNSGVSVYRRASLEAILAKHTLSIYAEDLENSLLLLAGGERIYYDDRLAFDTDAKRTWRGLLSQRVGWSFGGAKVLVERLPLFVSIARRSPVGAYQYLFYLGFNGYAMLPFKLASIVILTMSFLNGLDDLSTLDILPDHSWNDPVLFALWYTKTVVVLSIACFTALPRGERGRHLPTIPFYPFYSLLQYVPATIGVTNLVMLRFFGRRLFSDHYDRAPKLFELPPGPAAPGVH